MKSCLFIFCIIAALYLLYFSDESFANSRCPNLSYSLTSFHKGELDRTCKQQVASARNNGFTTITIVPAIEYSLTKPKECPNRICPKENTMENGELTRCLQAIWNSGLNIVYQPHLDSTNTLKGTKEVAHEWRANFDFDPTKGQYYESMFQEFETFLNKKKLAIGSRQIDVVVAAELEVSTTKYPAQWRHFTQDMRTRYKNMGIHETIRIGFNPNHNPKSNPSIGDWSDFKSFVDDMDFIAPSLYGDWSELTHPCSTWRDVNKKKADVLEQLSRGGRVDEFKKKPFAVGEFGTGGDFKATSSDLQVNSSKIHSYITKRRKLYKNLIEWAANEPSIRYPRPLALNIWTLGIFDPLNTNKSRNINK